MLEDRTQQPYSVMSRVVIITFAFNSATHSGRWLFFFGLVKTTMDTGSGGI